MFAHTFFFFTYYICGLEHIKNLKSLDILSKSKRKKKVHTLEKSIVYLFSIDFYNSSYFLGVCARCKCVCVYFFFFYCETVIMSSLSFLCKTKYCLHCFFPRSHISMAVASCIFPFFYIYIYKKWYTPFFFFRLDEFPNNSLFLYTYNYSNTYTHYTHTNTTFYILFFWLLASFLSCLHTQQYVSLCVQCECLLLLS